jgi:hypothetical protein
MGPEMNLGSLPVRSAMAARLKSAELESEAEEVDEAKVGSTVSAAEVDVGGVEPRAEKANGPPEVSREEVLARFGGPGER